MNTNKPNQNNSQGYLPPTSNPAHFQQQQFYNQQMPPQQFQFNGAFHGQNFQPMGQQGYQSLPARPPPNGNYFNPNYLNSIPPPNFLRPNFPMSGQTQNYPSYYNGQPNYNYQMNQCSNEPVKLQSNNQQIPSVENVRHARDAAESRRREKDRYHRSRSRNRSRSRSDWNKSSRRRQSSRSRSPKRRYNRSRSRSRHRSRSRSLNRRNQNNNRREEPHSYRKRGGNGEDRGGNNSRYSKTEARRSDYARKGRQRRDSYSRSRSSSETRQMERVKSTEPVISFVQTTLIPIYYKKDENNAKIVKATNKLNDLCNRFQSDILARSIEARRKANLPLESVQIPNYRQLLLTKQFSNYSRCTCDHSKHEAAETGCGKHKKKSVSSSDSSSGSSDSSSSGSSSDSSSNSSGTSSGSSSDSGSSSGSDSEQESNGARQKKKLAKKKKSAKPEDKFEDIKSMEMKRKMNHPERLHMDLCFNEPDQTNDGPLCKCKLKSTTFGTRHQIYYGEQRLEPCDLSTNNSDKLFHYRMTITPSANFKLKVPTKIKFDVHDYIFEGYSFFSHEPIGNIPDCVVVIYNQEYKLNLVAEDFIENFTIREVELLKQFVFHELLELYDLKWKGYNVGTDGCNRYHIMPRFCRNLPYDGKEILSPCEILQYLLDNQAPVVDKLMLDKCMDLTNREWMEYVEGMQGSIVTYPGKRPSSIRLDQLDRDHIKPTKDRGTPNEVYPLIIHFASSKTNYLMPLMKTNNKYKRLFRKYFKLRHLINNKSKPTLEDKAKLRLLGDQLEAMLKKTSDTTKDKEIMIELSAEHFHQTGIRTDLAQQAVLVPTLVEHLRFHASLHFLEKKIGYHFKNRLLLQYALTHPSGAFLLHQNLGANPDHVKNALFNCRVRNPQYGLLTSHKRKSILRKKGIHMLFSIMARKANIDETDSGISNYERLEFMGDKILELLVSRHLFCLFPMFDEGQLSEYRNALVQNQYLAVLARRLDMHYFIIFYHGVDLCSNSALNHALANSFEAILAAIFLDSNLETCSEVLARTLWKHEDTMDLYSIWSQPPMHPIQAQLPDGDRHLIKGHKILQHVAQFEELIGIEFKHIRLLAQAFCTRSVSFNLITLGDNQRLEFLGDTVLNFVVSDYLYRFFPNHHEGHLSLLRSSLVCNSTQALLYDELGMSDFVLTSYINNRQEPQGNLKRKADVFEAFVGALYLDQGLEAVSVFCHVTMFNKLQDIIMYQFWNDPKSRLQQCCLSLRDVDDSRPSLPTYKCIEERGPPNHKTYRVAVYFNRKRIGEGSGKSIHEAEVEAAKNALNTKSKMFPILDKYVATEHSFSKYLVDASGQKKTTNV